MGSVHSYFSSPSPLPLSSPSRSPSSPPKIKYDVFLNFRGKDTRSNFTSHLYKALRDKGIDTFIDYQLRRGDEIPPSLLQAIEESLISIVVFSENYADSKWCLEELVKILECKKNYGQIVIPVFYELDPSNVRYQTGRFAIALARHQKCFKENLDKVQQWRYALKVAANLSGIDSSVVKPNSVLVEKIVEDVLKTLNDMPSSDNNNLIGIESKITEIEVLLRMGDQLNNDVRKVGIWGIGGIGKTTLAKAVFDKIYCQFEGFYFIGSVREASEKKELNCLRDKLYLAILEDKDKYTYIFTRKRLHRKKLLIIFDDVTSLKQVEDLIGDLGCFGSGSRIIITSRDHQVLKNCGVDDIYKVEELCSNDALKLFCKHAFKQNCPKVDYKELSKGVVKKVGGVPLALKVLGSFLLDKGKEVWESSMKKLENTLDNDIHEVLKISYDGLDYYQQRIFLDIACFYKGWDVNLVIAIMDACDFFTTNELSALTDKSMIMILDNKLIMHDLLQAMGKRIVRQESMDPGERTRLCNHNDIYYILNKATGTKTIEGISLNMSNTRDIHLHPCAFVNMHNLKFLQFYISDCQMDDNNNNKVHVSQELKFLLTELRYLQWDRCPLKSLQPNFHLKDLVILKLPGSNVEQLWSGVQKFDHLKEISLDWSHKLTRFPNLRAPKLERLSLNECTSLIEMPSSFQHLIRLMDLSLFACENLTRVPQLPESLRLVDLESCSKLERLPELPINLEILDLAGCSSLIEIQSSIQHLTRLHALYLRECINLTSIPDCTGLISLQHLHLSHCSKLERLPEIPNNFEQLDFVGCTNLFEILSSFKHLNKMKELSFWDCKSLTSIPDLTGLKSLKRLTIEGCSKLKMLPEFPNSVRVLLLEKIPMKELPPSSENLCTLLELSLVDCSRLKSLPNNFYMWKSLKQLSLQNCPNIEIPDSVGCLTSLERLELDRNNFERLPESIINLSNLRYLTINHCERLKALPKLPWAHVEALDCTSLQYLSCPSFPNDFFALNSSQFVLAKFFNCFKLDPNSLDSFVRDTQQEIQAQSPSYRQVYEGNEPPLTIWYPSSEIPEWFDIQSGGSFIDVNLPLDWIDYNFLCFALCVVVSFPDQCDSHCKGSIDVIYECNVKSKKAGHEWSRMCGYLVSYFDFGYYNTGSSYVIIGFDFDFFRELHDNEFSFQFYVSNVFGSNLEHCKVEKCGVRLIFGKHLEKSDESKEINELHVEESNEEDEPHLEEFD